MSKFFDRIAFCYNIIPFLLRVNYPIEKEMSFRKNKKILEVGGGTGRLAKKIVDMFDVKVTILDLSGPMLKQVRFCPKIETAQGDIENTSFQDSSFDGIICVDTLHHLENPNIGLKEMARILKPGGKIYIQDFDKTKFRTKILRFVEKYLLKEPSRFYSPEELSKVLRKIGFSGFSKPILAIQYLYIGKKNE